MPHRYQILKPDWIITVNADFEVLQDYAVVIKDNRIHSLASVDEIRQLACYPEAQIIDLPGRVLMPGLVNSHTHASMSLLRGIADDLPLMDWLGNHIWPAEARWVDARFCVDGFQLAAAEMIRSGTTCMNDMYFFADEIARCAEQIGMRLVVGLIVLDFPSVWAQNADEYLHKALAVHDEVRGLQPGGQRLRPACTLHRCRRSAAPDRDVQQRTRCTGAHAPARNRAGSGRGRTAVRAAAVAAYRSAEPAEFQPDRGAHDRTSTNLKSNASPRPGLTSRIAPNRI